MSEVTINTKECTVCGQTGTIVVNGMDEYIESAHRYNMGELIQDAFPYLSIDEREQIISGTHPACWKALFPAEEDDMEC